MEPVWEDPPVPEAPFFTRDLYDKYSLAPTIRELWAYLQSPVEKANIKQDCDVGALKASCSSSTEEAVEFKDNSCISKEESRWDSCDSNDPCADNAVEGAEESKGAKKSRLQLKLVENEVDAAYPEPRLPFLCISSLSSKEQKTYLDILMSKKRRDAPERLKARVNNEVMQFMRYLQDVAKICADDYNFISQGAMQYSEDFFRGCLECIKTFPQLYQIHEMTSLTGGMFNPGLTLTFEKQLLIMGNVDITDHKIVPADAHLATDYQSVSSENPPAKKAKDMHATVSSDNNAENLCARYEPHVCLTRDALVRLLDNHGPDFGEQWEMPVWVKLNTGKGSCQKKTVYIDSPLLKTEMTVRERSHIYHEESLKLSIKKNGSKNVFHLMTELPMNEQQISQESSQRNLVCFENSGLDFAVDLTDLETFGETTPSKTTKMQKEQDASVKSRTKRSIEQLVNTCSSSEEMNTSLTDIDNSITEETTQPVVSETIVPKSEQMKLGSVQKSDEDLAFTGDSDDEKLVIDDCVSPAATPKTQSKPKTASCSADPPITPVSEPVPANSDSSSPQKAKRQKRQSKRAKVSGDQLSEILCMQTAMFSSAKDTAKCSTVSQETNPPTQCMGPSAHSHPISLVKPCVSSYLERNQNKDGETWAAPHESAPVVNITTPEHKKILSQDLQAGVEDEQDYKAPEEGNLLYKLYSLQDLLLMVRSSVSLTHTRKVGGSQNQYVPVQVLPKLEYQLNYGVECLTSSEACQLWTETLLHSSTVSYIAHINAHTSKVALLRKLPDDWKQNISCGFKPSKSLNILHHLLKKMTRLEEGQYLIAHKAGEPFVTFLKATNGKVSRGAYNLQQVHSSVPQPPASGPVPWIPVDPAVVLPFHQKHGRVPCTFPLKTTKDGSSQSNSHGAGQSKNNMNVGGKTKKKKNKRAARRNKYIKKLVQKSI
ncbi:little elongation complex subunit 2 [Chelmon rostratus]|uniref:little elongation complex subunit 2 n=1 Tax=Chelmon rostratus TaxID=109905 RepID=UPI001BEA1C25|nr:little elongation complex subunit 2 [Chelmon rostratus]